MKSTRRHELESNDLVGSATALAGQLRPYRGAIGVAAAVVAVALMAWSLVASRRTAARAESAGAFLKAVDAGQVNGLEDVMRRYPNTPAAHWSQMTIADNALARGLQTLGDDRERAQALLTSAEQRYGQVLGERPGGLVEERALFGSAKTLEALGRLDEAKSRYGEIVAKHPTSGLRSAAAARLADLDRETTRQWYAWFAQQTPSPSAAADGPAASVPQLDSAPAGVAAEPGSAGGPGTSPEPGAGQPAAAGSGTDASR